jgi:hypothetical protein
VVGVAQQSLCRTPLGPHDAYPDAGTYGQIDFAETVRFGNGGKDLPRRGVSGSRGFFVYCRQSRDHYHELVATDSTDGVFAPRVLAQAVRDFL